MLSNQPTQPLIFSVSEFVDLLNQTLEFAYPFVTIVGELSGFKISKNRWVYFDLKDETASVKCFGTVYMLPGPLEDGMVVQISGSPRLHPNFGFSINLQSIRSAGEGSLKRAATLLEAKLKAEGLFAPERKRTLPFPPKSIGLITSSQSAAYADFIKIVGQRWSGLEIVLADVQVQGDQAPAQLIKAIEHFNQQAKPPEVLVVIRGGGGAEDLAAFNNEAVVRVVAGSRIPTLVAIGHEVDLCLAELAADRRASTPSNAAELLSPDKKRELELLGEQSLHLGHSIGQLLQFEQHLLENIYVRLAEILHNNFIQAKEQIDVRRQLLSALAPTAILQRGYAIVRSGNQIIRSGRQLKRGQMVSVQTYDANIDASVVGIQLK